MEWTSCFGSIWDYEKVFYEVKLHNGKKAWAWPNAGELIDVGLGKASGQKIPIEDVGYYREAEEEYFEMMENKDV
jgi:hypothetical protein